MNYIGHNKHGLTTYIDQNKMSSLDAVSVERNKHSCGILISILTIYNVYKPPLCNWIPTTLPVCQHPSIYIGDFNFRNTEWGYTDENKDEVLLSIWATINRSKLIYDAKPDAGTPCIFEFGRWDSKTSPDLCFVSEDQDGILLSVNRVISEYFREANTVL